MRKIAVAFGVLMFLLNPNLACDDGGPQFQYGEAEMRAAVEGSWLVTFTASDGTSTQVTLRIEEGTGAQTSFESPGLVRSAYACGSRTFVKSAAACLDVSLMPLGVAVVAGDGAYASATWSGSFVVGSTVFVSGQLGLSFGNLYLQANVLPDGSVASAYLNRASDSAPTDLPTVSLTRL
jgi:enamine deaminase RidA (YjgF/YER057c/UK114 family)